MTPVEELGSDHRVVLTLTNTVAAQVFFLEPLGRRYRIEKDQRVLVVERGDSGEPIEIEILPAGELAVWCAVDANVYCDGALVAPN